MLQPVIYIGFGGGDLRNYWPASYETAPVTAGVLFRSGDLAEPFRYAHGFRALHRNVTGVVAGSTELVVAGASHGHSADSLALTQARTLAIQ